MRKLEKGAAGGLAVAATAIALGFALEGGRLGQVLQPTAALIVLGGTLGAVLVQFPLPVARQAARALAAAFVHGGSHVRVRMDQILRYGAQSKRLGLVTLDPELKKIEDPFFRRALMLAIDGVPWRQAREILELESATLEEQDERAARVWEAAGGFAPTVGILGAVLGLIQVMQHLDDVGEIGRGIAVAFVATLYGVGFANLFLLPVAGKLRGRAREAQRLRELTLEGVLAMAEGASTRILRARMEVQAGERAPAVVAPIEAKAPVRAPAKAAVR